MFEFGSGTLWGVPLAGTGNPPTNPTPQKLGVLQECTIDIAYDIKELYGQKQFPEAIARGKAKVTGKAKFARIYSAVFNQLMFAQTSSAPMKIAALDESAAIPATPFQVTVTNAATFFLDLGVIDQASGAQLVRVASGPVAGQYSVNSSTGVYTFAAADTGKTVLISYYYAAAGSTGFDISVQNQLMGFQPQFQAAFKQTFQGKEMSILFANCVAAKISMASKQDDFMIPEFDFSCFTDSSGQLCHLYFAE